MPVRTLAPLLALIACSAFAVAHEPGDTPPPSSTGAAPATSGSARPSSNSQGLWCFAGDRRVAEAAYENRLNDAVSPASLRAYHEKLAARPHRAGSEGDLAVIAYLASQFEQMGLDVETQWLDLYLAKPVAAKVEVLKSSTTRGSFEAAMSDMHRVLSLKEPEIEHDPHTADPALDIGWNAWSGTGEATAEVVYANYGRKEDFEQLKELGVDVNGKIVIARYGGNYRGYKAKYAEDHGAAGLVIYYDPEDVGYSRGLMYPEGGWANEHSIQRGSLLTGDYEGDPLSPGFASVPGAPTLDPKDVTLPTIPVQPIGWGAARVILESMDGTVVPEAWQGGLPFNYRLTSGPDVQVKVKVEQVREMTRTANVVATLTGAKHPEEFIVIGCHHDAWNHGAADPLAGLMVVLEMARAFAAEAAAGNPPDRSILFAAWAAEEYGLMGSTEWVEANLDRLRENCIAYINLDMAAMGPNFHAASSPSIARALVDATRDVPHCDDADAAVFAGWTSKSTDGWPQIGTMGGGSDHVGFLCLAGVPCMGIGAGGSPGTSYHTNYDTLAWYHKVVGEDYLPAVMVTKIVNTLVARMANADVPPVDTADILVEVDRHLRALVPLAEKHGLALAVTELATRISKIASDCQPARASMSESLLRGRVTKPETLAAVCTECRAVDRVWLGEGLPDRPWYRSRFMAPDRDSGYASWPLPELRAALEDGDADRAAAAIAAIDAAASAISAKSAAIAADLENGSRFGQ